MPSLGNYNVFKPKKVCSTVYNCKCAIGNGSASLDSETKLYENCT